MKATSLTLPDDIDAAMREAAAELGQSPGQFCREAVLLRLAAYGGGVSDELRTYARELAELASKGR